MKHSKRILAYSAFALIVMLAAVAGIAPAASSVALAQTVPAAPDVTATSPTNTSITLSWNAVSGAVTYEVRAYDEVGGHRSLSDVSAPTTTITDSNLVTGRAYFYWVRGVNSDDGQGPWSARADLVAGGAPDTPANLAGTAGLLQNSLTWDAVANADHYEVWGRLSTEANNYRELDLNQASNSYTHTGLTAGQSWYYWVRAVDGNGTKGLYAGPEVLTVLTPTPVGAPPSFTATMGNTEITISWGASAPLTGVTITGYEFRYRESGGTWGAWTADAGNDLTETITGLSNDTDYDFQVRATTSVGPGTEASRTQTPATVPGVPSSFSATATYNSVSLSWAVPADNGGAQVSSYRIEFLNDQSVWVTLGSILPASRTSYTHGSRDRSTQYQYRLHAINAAGEGPAASTSILTLANAPEKPAAPQNVEATAVTLENGGGKVDLSWAAPAFNGGSAITTYHYRWKEDTATASYGGWINAGQKEDGSGPNTMVQVETGLTPGKTYLFQVAATNAIAQGDPATSGMVTVLSTAPTAAPTLSAVYSEEAGVDMYTLTWTKLNDSDNGGQAFTDYLLQWKTDADDSEWAPIDVTFVADTVVYTVGHTATEPGTTYNYRVRALNGVRDDDDDDGLWSNEVSVTTPANVPDAPGSTADAADGTAPTGRGVDADTIEVSWAKPANDGGAAITSYEIQVRIVNGDFVDNNGDENTGNSLITNLVASRTKFNHDGVRNGVLYFYRVRAVNSAGMGPWSPANTSGFSTLTAAPGTPDAPTGFTASEGSGDDAGTVALDWTAPVDPGTRPITHYEIEYQRVDDNDVEANNDADIADWSDATSVRPTPPTMTEYTHTNAAGGATYHYRVRAVNGNGPGTWIPDPDVANAPDVMVAIALRAPNAPVLTATATGKTDILLTWNVPESNGSTITGFEIQLWDGTSDYGALDIDPVTADTQNPGATDTQYAHTGLDAGAQHYYRILAVGTGQNNATVRSAWSTGHTRNDTVGAATATTESGTPGRPATFMAVSGDGDTTENEDQDVGKITLNWTVLPANSGGSKLTGYEIEILDISTRTWVPETTVAGDVLTYTDDELEPGKTYYYILRAVNSDGAGDWHPYVSAVAHIGVPDAPVLTATAASRSSIELSWTVPDNNGRPITGYEIQRWDSTDWATQNLLTGDRLGEPFTDFTHTGLTAATKYYYRIRALTGDTEALQGDWSVEGASTQGAASATTDGDTPDAPTLSNVAGAGTTATLTWTAPTDDGGPAITGYSVQRWNSDTNTWDEIATPAHIGSATQPQTYSDPGRTPGTTYYYRVAAVNSQGTGEYTAYDDAEIVATDAAAPTLTATATGPRTIELSWNIPAANGRTLSGFQIQIWGDTDDQPDVVELGWVDVGSDLDTIVDGVQSAWATQTLYIVDTGLVPNQRYDFQIRTLTQTSGEESDYAHGYAMTHIGAPDKPVVTATADGENKINLEWEAPEDYGSPIDRYEIWMWDTTLRAWGWGGVAGAVLTVSHPLTTYTHSGLDAGTQNIYRVRAVNDATNDNNGVGDWSTIVAGRTDEAE